jgi:hypothetical protein
VNRRVAFAAGIVAFAVAAIAGILLLAGDDGKKPSGRAGSLIWADEPKLVYPQSLPTDRILYGQVRNDGLRDIRLSSVDLRVVDVRGRALRSDGRFLQAYVHGMYGAFSRDKDIGAYERRRLGIVLTLKPGEAAPLTVAWHGRGARSLQIGDVKLPIPVRT